MSTWKTTVSSGTITTPPPNPVSAPRNPATSAPNPISAVNSSVFKAIRPPQFYAARRCERQPALSLGGLVLSLEGYLAGARARNSILAQSTHRFDASCAVSGDNVCEHPDSNQNYRHSRKG